MFSSAHVLHTTVWLEEWRKVMSFEGQEVPEVLKNRLVDPLKLGDPVFCTALCKELVKSENIIICLEVLGKLEPSKPRIFQCELLFYLCKCSAAESRLFIANLIPLLLWMEWILTNENGIDNNGAKLEEDLIAIEVALLAAFQQDFNINPLPPSTRVTSIRHPSIYHDGSVQKDADLEVFPYNTIEGPIISAPIKFYPSYSLDKLDDYSRSIITFRLCRYFQEHIPEIEDLIVISYAFFLIRLSTIGTKLDDHQEFLQKVQSQSIFSHPSSPQNQSTPDRLSNLCSEMSQAKLSNPEEMPPNSTEKEPSPSFGKMIHSLKVLFFPQTLYKARRRFPLKEDLIVLWSDVLSIIKSRFPLLEDHVRQSLLSRGKVLGYPKAIIALDT